MNNCTHRLEVCRSNVIAYYVCLHTKKPITLNQCVNCESIKIPAQISTPQPMPKLTTRIHSYVTALKEWKKAGKPIRSDEEVLRIFEVFCDKCKSHKKNKCLFCGCRVAINGYPITNKIKMATEHCPKELW